MLAVSLCVWSEKSTAICVWKERRLTSLLHLNKFGIQSPVATETNERLLVGWLFCPASSLAKLG